eukprot:CAMPEP_0115163444 /NCGR_PEP_ID=MMETSP0227-20121206/72515_1 /TAXON_ID=89957 /ORGANISM="Polarella glacialis, Strain CCMP 1383" /LENGTH=66 /DNA_ID=CAMNT_0002575755 /DNA_START=64 /DNA_END=261 /DNA_ORIENTATION=+
MSQMLQRALLLALLPQVMAVATDIELPACPTVKDEASMLQVHSAAASASEQRAAKKETISEGPNTN